MKPYRSIFLCVISAMLLVYSFPTSNFWILAWCALVPFFLAIRDKNLISTFLLGLLWGLVFFYGAIWWLNSIAVAATVALVCYLALYFAVFAVFAKAVVVGAGLPRPYMPVVIKAILLASGWVVLEFIRSHFLTGFGWNLLGYSQASFLPAIQIADITGAYGVSFIVVFVNVTVYEFLFTPSVILRRPAKRDDEESKGEILRPFGAQNDIWKEPVPTTLRFSPTVLRLLHNRLINLLLCIFLITLVFIYGFYKLSTTQNQNPEPRISIKVSVIQGNIPQTLKWDASYRDQIIKKYFRLTLATSKDNPDLIIWPETSFPVDLETEPELAGELFGLARNVNAYLLVGANRFKWINPGMDYEKIYNSAFLIDSDGRINNFYDKLHLVPFGEYMPRVSRPLLKILPEKINMVGDFSPGVEYTVFKIASTAANNVGAALSGRPQYNQGRHRGLPLQFSVLICFEDVFPELSRRFIQNGAQFLVNITNDAWYGISSAPFQHAQASIFRAVENRVFVIRAANTGLSIFIDRKGRVFDGVVSESGQNISIEGYKTGFISKCLHSSPVTFYNRYGDVFAIACFFVLGVGFFTMALGKSKA